MSLNEFIDNEREYFLPMLSRAERSSPEQRKQWRLETVNQRQERISFEVYNLLGGRVRYGPFKGLKLNRDTWWGRLDLGSMCLGLYEKELLNFIDRISPNQFSCFIDIGAADGYYACGLLSSGKVQKAICFEQNLEGREVIQSNWEKNNSIGELLVFGEANAHSISSLPSADLQNALVLVDIEGAEFDALTEDVLETLKFCTVIVEIHNWVDDFLTKYEQLLSDMHRYFDVEIIQRVERPTSEFEELRDFTDDNRLLLTSERRPCLMRFLMLIPKVKGS